MNRIRNIAGPLLFLVIVAGCAAESKKKDRSEASDMFRRISALTEHYISKVEQAADSAAWVEACVEFEDSLDKINFHYPPDTDLLLTESQNDTIHMLMQEYIRVRDARIHKILYPAVELDSLNGSDSLQVDENTMASDGDREDASRSHDN